MIIFYENVVIIFSKIRLGQIFAVIYQIYLLKVIFLLVPRLLLPKILFLMSMDSAVCNILKKMFTKIVDLVWMVAAQVTEKQKTIISRPNPLLFKRA